MEAFDSAGPISGEAIISFRDGFASRLKRKGLYDVELTVLDSTTRR